MAEPNVTKEDREQSRRSIDMIVAVALAVITFQPASAQVATQGDIEILNRRIMDLDLRLRALEGEKEGKRQAEQADARRLEQERQTAAYLEERRNCDAYKRRIVAAPPVDPQRAGAAEMRMLDQLDESSCKHADKFEADSAANARAMDQKKR
ncbi:MAG TPA: hypothetical protein VK804_27555 [Bradyrhizobium sp.]|jgi:hypothetical protein|uniref:hypothetical protein n=1 Tax=Bradyrhizobium sp. TaxID=376 RepID=UPI002C9531F8|nr:hypothetical protein [Bradyrhizobium sp.]HTB04241.1 hypothetical protein [Bradyrhizobium sp.]